MTTASEQRARETRSLAARALATARQGIDHSEVALAVYDNGGLTGRYLIMTVISAAIAILGLMLSSPAVVIGAMLVSPMMGPIVALGFSLTLLDWTELKQSLVALGVGVGLALLVSVLLTVLSPLKEATPEIIARTRPNFFDLLIAVFSGVAGAYAVIRQRGETIIGVAIATALMPPVAAVGFGLGTGDWRIAMGAGFLFMTNLVAIAVAATVTAGFYGFRPRLLERPKPWRALAVVVVFAVLAVPLVVSLRAIGLESRATAETRLAVEDIFAGAESRITLLDARAVEDGLEVSALVSTRQLVADAQARLQERLVAALHIPVQATLDQIVVADPAAAARAVQASQTQTVDPAVSLGRSIADAVPFPTEAVTVDPSGGRALVLLGAASGLDLDSAYALERALAARFEGVTVWVSPPVRGLEAVDLGDQGAADRAVWALTRWRASPRLTFCDPAPGVEASEDAAARPGAEERFRTRLIEAGVVVAEGAGPACEGGDDNIARVALD